MPNERETPPRGRTRAFTLIELLIVVAIIAILAAIAVPNFVEAKTRATVARAKSDLRTLMVAVESYRVDHSDYPFRRNTKAGKPPEPAKPSEPLWGDRPKQLSVLTTPISYISQLLVDPFDTYSAEPNNLYDYFDSTQSFWMIQTGMSPWDPRRNQLTPESVGFLLMSVGPDGYLGPLFTHRGWPIPQPYYIGHPIHGSELKIYDPTNGTLSTGNIYVNQRGAGAESFITDLTRR